MQQDKEQYSQTEIANILGISKSTVSRWVSRNNVACNRIDGKKMYDATVLQQIKQSRTIANNSHNSKDSRKKKSTSVVDVLQSQVLQQQDEIELLKHQLEIKDNQIADFKSLLDKTQELAGNAQTLNLLDKPKDTIPPKAPIQIKRHWWQFWK